MSFHALILSLLASRSIPLSHQFNKHSISILIVYFFHSFFANLASFRFYQLYSYLQLFCVLCNLKAPPVSPQRFTRKMLCKFSGIFRWPNLFGFLYILFILPRSVALGFFFMLSFKALFYIRVHLILRCVDIYETWVCFTRVKNEWKLNDLVWVFFKIYS